MADESRISHQIQVPVRIERAPRMTVLQSGTVRERSRFVMDVVIADLSRSGCLLKSDERLQIGTLISIGIPGLGMQAARVVRTSAEGDGCEFLLSLNDGDVDSAMTAKTVIDVRFPQMRERLRDEAIIEYGDAPTRSGGKAPIWATLRARLKYIRQFVRSRLV